MNNIKKSEQNVLVLDKVRKGKEQEVAQAEVQRDINYINNLKKIL